MTGSRFFLVICKIVSDGEFLSSLSCLRSDEQRSEQHKLKKERQLEKEVMEAEREDDGGFSKVEWKTLTLFYYFLMQQILFTHE